MAVTSSRASKKGKRLVSDAVVHIDATFNNTIITFTDLQGNVLCWSSAGGSGFRGARKSTPYAAQEASAKVATVASEEYGVKSIQMVAKGPGPGRDPAMRRLQGMGFKVTMLRDATKLPHNGCRPRKKRRV